MTTPRPEHLLVERTALNDVVVNQPKMARLFELDAFVDGDAVASYRADGLIICTPTGSTAYNLAAGGPILMPNMEALVISPICPHTLTARPLVVHLRSVVEVRPGRDAEQALLTVDGQWSHMLGPHDVVEVTCSDRPLTIFRPLRRSFFDLLRNKLHWGLLRLNVDGSHLQCPIGPAARSLPGRANWVTYAALARMAKGTR